QIETEKGNPISSWKAVPHHATRTCSGEATTEQPVNLVAGPSTGPAFRSSRNVAPHDSPLMHERTGRHRLARATIPVASVPVIAFDAVTKGVSPIIHAFAFVVLAYCMYGLPLRSDFEPDSRQSIEGINQNRNIRCHDVRSRKSAYFRSFSR